MKKDALFYILCDSITTCESSRVFSAKDTISPTGSAHFFTKAVSVDYRGRS